MRQAAVLDARRIAQGNPQVDMRLLKDAFSMNRAMEGLGVTPKRAEYNLSHPLDSFAVERPKQKTCVCSCQSEDEE